MFYKRIKMEKIGVTVRAVKRANRILSKIGARWHCAQGMLLPLRINTIFFFISRYLLISIDILFLNAGKAKNLHLLSFCITLVVIRVRACKGPAS
jgi:hypothetical protein